MNNAAAIGYALMAARQMGLKGQQLKHLEGLMRSLMDEYTEDEAEEVYRKS